MGLSLLTSGNDAEILQIAATDGKDEFSIYVKPCYIISPEASAVNKLTFQRRMLFYDGKPMTDAVASNGSVNSSCTQRPRATVDDLELFDDQYWHGCKKLEEADPQHADM